MSIIEISINKLSMNPITIWEKNWFLLTAGDFTAQKFNCMTISWGSIGVMWNKPFVQVVVRPTRFTYAFMQEYPDFTVCTFPEKYRKAMNLLGSKSGRHGDKIAESKLSPCRSKIVGAPSYSEAELILECRKIFSAPFKPEEFINPGIASFYPTFDYHQVYYGEILAAFGDEEKYTK
jgi:flavin reductase (DIM6/NTAB) family NADH-FMN oxidoreductase RutF